MFKDFIRMTVMYSTRSNELHIKTVTSGSKSMASSLFSARKFIALIAVQAVYCSHLQFQLNLKPNNNRSI